MFLHLELYRRVSNVSFSETVEHDTQSLSKSLSLCFRIFFVWWPEFSFSNLTEKLKENCQAMTKDWETLNKTLVSFNSFARRFMYLQKTFNSPHKTFSDLSSQYDVYTIEQWGSLNHAIVVSPHSRISSRVNYTIVFSPTLLITALHQITRLRTLNCFKPKSSVNFVMG